MGIKKRRILRRIQKYKLALVQKCTQKKLLAKKDCQKMTFGGFFMRKYLKKTQKTSLNYYGMLGQVKLSQVLPVY